ncbi:MAG: hypothetical protein ACRCZI_03145 [Cetobacterium sp.]
MADLTVQNTSAEAGTVPTFAACSAGGDKFVWDSNAYIIIRNADAASKTVTVTPATTSFNDAQQGTLTKAPIALVIAAGGIGIIPPLPIPFRNSADLNKVAITYSAITSVTIAICKNKL